MHLLGIVLLAATVVVSYASIGLFGSVPDDFGLPPYYHRRRLPHRSWYPGPRRPNWYELVRKLQAPRPDRPNERSNATVRRPSTYTNSGCSRNRVRVQHPPRPVPEEPKPTQVQVTTTTRAPSTTLPRISVITPIIEHHAHQIDEADLLQSTKVNIQNSATTRGPTTTKARVATTAPTRGNNDKADFVKGETSTTPSSAHSRNGEESTISHVEQTDSHRPPTNQTGESNSVVMASESVPYSIICASPSDGYELRRYGEAVWVTTTVNGTSASAIRRLYRYIAGDNDQGAKIPVSRPIRKRMMRLHEYGRPSRDVLTSVSFYLPRRFWDDPPLPNDEAVFVGRDSSMGFTSRFRGRAEDSTRYYDRLRGVLIEEGHPIVDGEYDVQCYKPKKNMIHPNEILIEAESTSGTPPTCGPQPEATEEPPNGIRQCRDHECPSYSEVERITDDVIIRRVEAGVYATKKSTTCNMTNAMDETYSPLREYFMGENLDDALIPSTVPVLQLAVRPDRSDSTCNLTYQSSFYLPAEYQIAPPLPLDDSIVISEVDVALYYVMTFHETPTPRVAFQKYNELKSLVTEAGRCYLSGEFRLAFYDAPFRPLPHRYEMCIPVDEHCDDVEDEDFHETIFPVDEDGIPILPVLNDEPRVAVPPKPRWMPQHLPNGFRLFGPRLYSSGQFQR